jgi:hypothetical protein
VKLDFCSLPYSCKSHCHIISFSLLFLIFFFAACFCNLFVDLLARMMAESSSYPQTCNRNSVCWLLADIDL